MYAITRKNFDIVKLLVESNANMDARDDVSGVAVRLRVGLRLGYGSNADNTNAKPNTKTGINPNTNPNSVTARH